MVLASPGPLLTPPPSSSPQKTPHQSYSDHTRSQNEEKNLPPKQYLPLQTRTRHRLSHRPHVQMLMRGNTPSTTRSPPHLSRQTGNPSDRKPTQQTTATVGEEELGGRGPTSRWMLMKAGPDCRPPPTVWHAQQPRTSTKNPPATRLSPQGAASRHGEGGQRRRRTAAIRHTAGRGPRPGPAPAAARPAATAPHDTSPANNNRPEERRISCCQQPAPPPRDAAKISPHISIGPEPVLHFCRTTTAQSSLQWTCPHYSQAQAA
jgi:hypothetical protein